MSTASTAKAFRIGSYAVCAWLVAWPHPYAFVIALVAAVPWLLVLFSLARRDAIPQADLIVLQAICAGVLALRAALDSHLVLVGPLLLPSAIGAIVLVVAMLWPRSATWPWRKLLSLALVAFAYAMATIALVDQAFDAQDAEVVRLRVLSKRVTTGKGSTHYLRVPPWGLRRQPNDLQVDVDTYAGTAVGASVCVAVHPGALRMPWYEVRAAC